MKKDKIIELIHRGEEIKKKEYCITDEDFIMPDYIAGPLYDQWMSEIHIINESYLKSHPLYESINTAFLYRAHSDSAYDDMMGYLRALATDEGLTYFVEKGQNKQMKLLKGDARALLIELIENRDTDLAGLLAKKLKGSDFNKNTRFRATIKYLIDNDFLNIPQWGDNVPYIAMLTYEGEHYLEFETEEMKRIESQSNAQPNITIHSSGQINMASENATINANQYIGIDIQTLKVLIDAIKEKISTLQSEEDVETATDSLETLENELVQQNPRKGLIRTAILALKGIKGTAEFIVAVATLVQFIQTTIS